MNHQMQRRIKTMMMRSTGLRIRKKKRRRMRAQKKSRRRPISAPPCRTRKTQRVTQRQRKNDDRLTVYHLLTNHKAYVAQHKRDIAGRIIKTKRNPHKFNIADRNYHIIDDCGQFIEVMIVRAQQCQDYIGEFIMQDNTSAKAWILMDATKEFYIRGCNTQEKREIASITKMYTLYACLTLNKHFGIAPETTFLEVLPSVVSGTLANLVPNEYISIMDLYYGMMLPSGNDAACVLAFYYGSWLVTKKSYQGFPKSHKKENVGDKMKHYQLYTKKFVQFMNNFIVKQDLRHSHTHFENCHGLPDKDQVSTAWQLAQASLKFIKNPLFSHICSSKIHRGNYYESDYSFQWKNTNILLNEGYKGIKTGFTNTAGGCLSSLTSIPIDKYSRQQLLIIVLGSKDSDSRFRDTKIVVEDYKRYLNMMRL